MESEKVKEIKRALELGAEIGMSTQSETFIIDVKVSDILTYINELERENERLSKQLPQFAERLKEKAYPFPCAIGVEYAIPHCKIDETLKEFTDKV